MTTRLGPNLETFPNPSPERDYHIHMEIPEFSCLCPKTGQPDFATLLLDYIPERACIELKSLKLYIWSFRNEGAFHEAVTNRILNDLVAAAQPRFSAAPDAPFAATCPSSKHSRRRHPAVVAM